jgi:membrane protein DedA with SNARE-associated domain
MPIAIDFFVGHAYAILFLWVLVEQLGIPIPSIPLLLTAGTLSATHRLSASSALLVVVAACLISDSTWYALGRRYGSRVLRLLCKMSLEAATCVSKTEGYFTRRGPVTLLFAKFVPGLSTVAAPIAGQTGMSYPRFLLFDLAGTLIWSGSCVFAGRFFGDIAKRSQAFFGLLSHFAALVFILMVIGFFVWRVVKNRRFLLSVRELRLEPATLKAMLDDAAAEGSDPPYIVDLRHPLDYLPDPRVLPGGDLGPRRPPAPPPRHYSRPAPARRLRWLETGRLSPLRLHRRRRTPQPSPHHRNPHPPHRLKSISNNHARPRISRVNPDPTELPWPLIRVHPRKSAVVVRFKIGAIGANRC